MSNGPIKGELVDEGVENARQLAKVDQLPPDLMLLKIENESIMALASTKPRDEIAVLKKLLATIEAYPEAADDAIYSKPIGTVLRVTCRGCERVSEMPNLKDYTCPYCRGTEPGKQQKVKKFAEGLSIRAAESIRSIFGYNRLAVTMKMQEDGKARISATFIDYSSGIMTTDERVVSPYYTTWDKKAAKTPEDRFINVVVKAEKAKLRRDVILDSVPAFIKAAYRDSCEKKLAALITPERIEKEIIPNFATLGLSRDDLETRIIGRPISLGWTEGDRLKLRQIYAALKDGETTVAELLADPDDETTSGSSKATKGSVDDAIAKGKKPAPKKESAPPPQTSAPPPPTLSAEDVATMISTATAEYALELYDKHCGLESTHDEAGRAVITAAFKARVEALKADSS